MYDESSVVFRSLWLEACDDPTVADVFCITLDFRLGAGSCGFVVLRGAVSLYWLATHAFGAGIGAACFCLSGGVSSVGVRSVVLSNSIHSAGSSKP